MNTDIDNVVYENNRTKLNQYLQKTHVNLANKLPIYLLKWFNESYVFKHIPLIKPQIWENLLKVNLTNKDYDLLIEELEK